MPRLLIFLALALVGALAAWWFAAPPGQGATLAAVRGAGFPQAVWVAGAPGTIRLDMDGFSTLSGVRAARGGGVVVARAALIGEVSAQGAVTIAGWDGTTGAVPRAAVEEVRLNLDTPLGAVLVTGRAALGPDALSAHLRTEQAPLALTAEVRARRGDAWAVGGEVSMGRLTLPGVNLTRVTGEVENDALTFKAGGLRLGQTVWGGVHGRGGLGGWSLEAQALDAPGVRLALGGSGGTIEADTARDLAAWAREAGLSLPEGAKGAKRIAVALDGAGKVFLEPQRDTDDL